MSKGECERVSACVVLCEKECVCFLLRECVLESECACMGVLEKERKKHYSSHLPLSHSLFEHLKKEVNSF